MIAISHLLEKQTQFEPWMVGTAKQSGGKGYPGEEYQRAKESMQQQQQKMKSEARFQARQTAEAKKQARAAQNLRPEDRV